MKLFEALWRFIECLNLSSLVVLHGNFVVGCFCEQVEHDSSAFCDPTSFSLPTHDKQQNSTFVSEGQVVCRSIKRTHVAGCRVPVSLAFIVWVSKVPAVTASMSWSHHTSEPTATKRLKDAPTWSGRPEKRWITKLHLETANHYGTIMSLEERCVCLRKSVSKSPYAWSANAASRAWMHACIWNYVHLDWCV